MGGHKRVGAKRFVVRETESGWVGGWVKCLRYFRLSFNSVNPE